MKSKKNKNASPPRTSSTSGIPQSLKQSFYIAALDRYLGLRGFIFPIDDIVNRLTYDFLHQETGAFVKVFTTTDPKHLEPYELRRPERNPIYIVDAEQMDGVERIKGPQHNLLLPKNVCERLRPFSPYVYYDDTLWEHDPSNEERDCWVAILPDERARCIIALTEMELPEWA